MIKSITVNLIGDTCSCGASVTEMSIGVQEFKVDVNLIELYVYCSKCETKQSKKMKGLDGTVAGPEAVSTPRTLN